MSTGNAANGAAAHLSADPVAIASFAEALFRYADDDSYISVRAFLDMRGGKPFKNRGYPIGTSSKDITALATECAQHTEPVVFCPPVATFSNSHQAREIDLQNGLCLSVECDARPLDARQKLEALLGPATVVVASGGQWIDPTTGEVQDKLHLHWRLTEPTRTIAEHASLKRARDRATSLVGGDASNKPIVHPIRWPGSWHRKGRPRLACIVEKTESEIDLAEALELLEDATAAAGIQRSGSAQSTSEAAPSTREERETAELTTAILTGGDYHAAITALAMRFLKAGMPDAQAVVVLRGIMQSVPDGLRDTKDGSNHPGRWLARYDDIARAVSTARAKVGDGKPTDSKAEGTPQNDCAAWQIVRPTDLYLKQIPERRFIVDGWLAASTVTINFGDGGVGKTLLIQQLMTSTATGLPWIGLAVNRCKSIALFCEDDEDELHRRQHAINLAYGTDFDRLGDMQWISGVGHDNTLCTFDNDGIIKPSPSFLYFQERAVETGAGLIVIDTAADVFGGNEILRRQVRQFMGKQLGALAMMTGAAVVLNAHPSRNGLSDKGDMDGGSTAWSNTARARWSLSRPKADGLEDQADTNERILTKRKANYASVGDTIKMRWQRGVLVPTSGPTGLAALAGRDEAETVFLTILERLTSQGRPVSDSVKSGNYAPKEFAKQPDRQGFTKIEFDGAMQRLFAAGKIRMVEYGRAGASGKPRRIEFVGDTP